MLVDSHCHLYGEEYNRINLFEQIEKDNNLLFAVTLSSDENDAKLCKEIAEKNKKVFYAVGFHPENAESYTANSLKEIEKLAENEKCVAIGEVGLDYHYTEDNKSLQKQILVSQIELAYKLKKPLSIHCRDAASDLYDLLLNNKDKLKYGFVIHCFSETKEWAEKFSKLNAYFGICGNFTFKNYDSSVAKFLPLDRIMVETDSPYLAPVPVRGTLNTPLNVKYTLNKLAEVLNKTPEEMEEITTKNALKFYGIKIEP